MISVAKDRGWFKTYTPFASTIDISPFTSSPKQLLVLGIGTVEIPTKRSPNLSGVSSHGSLHLNEVLHVPDFLCNVIGSPINSSDGYVVEISFSSKSKGTIKDSQGKNMAYFDIHWPLFAIKVRGQSTGSILGSHALKQEGLYMLGCRWDFIQQRRWHEFKVENAPINSMSESADGGDRNPPYTDDEKVYLKKNWRSEYHFLLKHGFSIYKEEDRAEGRSILRAFRDKDGSEEKSGYHGLRLEDYQADWNLSFCQLECIEQCYGNRENFLSSYEAEGYDSDELKDAMAIADAIRAHDG